VGLYYVDRLQTEALVLRIVDFGESDCIVHLLTAYSGRVTAIAKGAKRSLRRFPGTLDFFHVLAIQAVTPRAMGMARLESARILESFESLRTDPRRFAFGCYFLELLDRLASEGMTTHDARLLFHFAREVVHFVAVHPPDLRIVTLLQLQGLRALGLRPMFTHCVRCNRPVEMPLVYFHVGEGGIVCDTCLRTEDVPLRVHLGTVRALEQGLDLPLARLIRLTLAPSALEEAREVVERFEHFHLGLELHSEPLLLELLTPAVGRLP